MLFLRKSDKNLPLALTSPPQKRWLSRPSGQQSIFNPPRGNRGGGKIPPYVWGTTLAAAGIVGYTYYAFLDTVPVTNRRRWIATPPHFEEDLGHSEYKKMLAYFQKQGEVLPPNHRASITVKRVGSRLADAAIKFGKRHEMAHLSNSPYTYTVVRSDMANAFVIPGNHVFVMTGLFKYTKNEDEIAAVLGHEMVRKMFTWLVFTYFEGFQPAFTLNHLPFS